MSDQRIEKSGRGDWRSANLSPRNRKVGRQQYGWKLHARLLKEGKSDLEALDLALESVIPKDGPEFSDNPPKPLSLKDQEEVKRRLDLREEAGEIAAKTRTGG